MILATFANPDGSRVRPGVTGLAQAQSVSERTAKRNLVALRESGWIKRTATGTNVGRRGGWADTYQLVIPAATETGDTSVTSSMARTGDTHDTGSAKNRCQKEQRTGDKNDTKPVTPVSPHHVSPVGAAPSHQPSEPSDDGAHLLRGALGDAIEAVAQLDGWNRASAARAVEGLLDGRDVAWPRAYVLKAIAAAPDRLRAKYADKVLAPPAAKFALPDGFDPAVGLFEFIADQTAAGFDVAMAQQADDGWTEEAQHRIGDIAEDACARLGLYASSENDNDWLFDWASARVAEHTAPGSLERARRENRYPRDSDVCATCNRYGRHASKCPSTQPL